MKRGKKILAMFLCLLMVTGSVHGFAFTSYAQGDEQNQQNDADNNMESAEGNCRFEGTGFTVEYVIDSMWTDQDKKGYNASVSITNTGDSDIESWSLQYGFQDEIVNMWNASYVKDDGKIVVSAGEGNINITPQQTVTYGFQAFCDVAQLPAQMESVSLLGVRAEASEADYEVVSWIQSQWNTGSVYEVTIKNVSDHKIKGWELSFALNARIVNLWNGTLSGNQENGYFVRCMDYNSWIEPGMTANFGFQTQYDNEGIADALHVNGMTEIVNGVACSSEDESEAMVDSDENDVADGSEDFDEDGLTNYEEFIQSTFPCLEDSDNDTLKDGEEIKIYGSNPLEVDTDFDGLTDGDEIHLGTDPTIPDTDVDGILDCDEKFNQTFTHMVENENCAIEEVTVSMEGTGNLQKNITIESIMGKDVICSGVIGLIGEPFSIETTSQFDTATLTFKIDQLKLRDTAFEDLMFLWYDEENYEFVELETFYNYEDSSVSIETTHFSRYMVVDKFKWFEAWSSDFNYRSSEYACSSEVTYDTVIAIDCSGSMSGFDSNGVNSKRARAVLNFLDTMGEGDRAGIILFTSRATVTCGLTDSQTNLVNGLTRISSSGGTSFSAALSTAVTLYDEDGTLPIIRRIILLSDGDDYVPYRILDKCKEKNIAVYTIGLGSRSDGILRTIATYTGGEFFKACTADDLLEIYSDIGFSSDFDTTDMDNDGLYDSVEMVGIRIQNGAVIYDCDPLLSDTDNDGLEDGQEIDPTIRWKFQYYCPSDVPESVIGKKYYFVMKSNPTVSDDTDRDGYADISDIAPTVYNDYSFLDDEIYSIGQFNESGFTYKQIEAPGISTNSAIMMNNANEGNSQKFRLKWCGTGYKIYPINGEYTKKVLTIDTEGNTHKVVIATDEDKPEQMWEILPRFFDDIYGEYSDGLIVRSKMMDYTTADKSLYLTVTSSNTLVVTSGKEDNTRFKLYSPNNWKRFGEVYLNCLGWQNTLGSNGMVSLDNYFSNVSIGLDSSNIESIAGKDYIIFQEGGNFPKLKFNSVKMNAVCCEIIGTYNALIMADVNVDFFKLALEFEYNATLVPAVIGGFTYHGMWGSDPYKIKDCLDAYHVSYTMFVPDDYSSVEAACKAYDNALLGAKGGVVSYNFQFLGLYLAIHTFAAIYDSTNRYSPIKTYNRFCGDTESKNHFSIYNTLTENGDRFMVGYVLY